MDALNLYPKMTVKTLRKSVINELKGGHIEKALRQIESSCEVMCKKSLMAPNKHERWHDLKIDGDIVRLPGHGKIVTGLILGKRGIALAQQQKLSIRKKQGIHLTFLQGNYTGKTLSELERIFHPAGA